MRIRHLWYHRMAGKGGDWRAAFLRSRPCDPVTTLSILSGVPQPELSWFSRWIAVFTTPFKFLGISGWTDTGCTGRGRGRLVRDAQHSTDGFWTLDLGLEWFSIDDTESDSGRFLRIEVEPGTLAHAVCEREPIRADQDIRFGSVLVLDEDGPFLEAHPDDDFSVIG